MSRPRYPRTTIRHERWGDEGPDTVILTFSRLEDGQLRSFQIAEVESPETINGINDAAKLLSCVREDWTTDMETLMQCAQNMVALAKGWRLVPR